MPCASSHSTNAPVTTPLPDIPNREADSTPPWEPAWGWLPPERTPWKVQFADRLVRSRQADIACVLLGDSLTAGWDGDHWQRHWGERAAVNLGIQGDTTQNLLYRITHGQLAALQPRCAVLLIGLNNIYRDPYRPADYGIARGIVACARSVASEWPTAQVLVLGLLPAVDRALIDRLAGINRLVASQNLFGAVYADVGHGLLTDTGDLDHACYQDDLIHLTPLGYERWASALQPILDRIPLR